MIHCLNPECNHINPDTERICQQCNSSLLIDDRYGAIKIIGKGGFGKTFLGKDYHSKNLSSCVIKQLLPSSQNQNQKNWQLFQEEATRLQSLNSYPQIPKLFGFFIQEKRYYIIQEFINGDTLALELKKAGYFTEEKIIKLLDELLPILKSIHRFNHCETEKPEQKFPNFESLNTEDSLPLSYDELACPLGYVCSISMMEVMGEYSAKVLPAITHELDGDNLRINQ